MLVNVLTAGSRYISHYVLRDAAIKAGQYLAATLSSVRDTHSIFGVVQVSNGLTLQNMVPATCIEGRETELVPALCA